MHEQVHSGGLLVVFETITDISSLRHAAGQHAVRFPSVDIFLLLDRPHAHAIGTTSLLLNQSFFALLLLGPGTVVVGSKRVMRVVAEGVADLIARVPVTVEGSNLFLWDAGLRAIDLALTRRGSASVAPRCGRPGDVARGEVSEPLVVAKGVKVQLAPLRIRPRAVFVTVHGNTWRLSL